MKGPWDLAPHTAAKHKIYGKYLDAWFPILIQRYGEVTYAEGFSGCGIYSHGEEGSPIIALSRLLRRRREFSQLQRARFLLVEKERHNAHLLAGELGKILNVGAPVFDFDDGVVEVRLRCGECQHELPKLLNESKVWGKPILAIFDTFGGGVPAQLLANIATNKSSEVIYTVLPQHFARFHSDHARGDAIFGDTAWRDVAQHEPYKKREHIAREFETTMRTAGFNHVLRFNLGTSRGDQLNLLYGTCSAKGVEKFKDALWNADPVQGAGFQDPRDPWQQMLPMHHEPDLAPLERLLHGLLLNSPNRSQTVEQLREFTKLHTIYKASHVTRCLTKLEKDKLIQTPTGALRLGTTTITARPPKPEQLSMLG